MRRRLLGTLAAAFGPGSATWPMALSDRVTSTYGLNIVDAANRLRLPAVYGNLSSVDQSIFDLGGRVVCGIDWPMQRIGGADCLAGILDGAKPADLPVQRPTRFELVVDLGNARNLGMTVPQTVLLQAAEVVQ